MFKKKQKCGVQEQNENKKVFLFSITCTWFQVNKPKDVNPDFASTFFSLLLLFMFLSNFILLPFLSGMPRLKPFLFLNTQARVGCLS